MPRPQSKFVTVHVVQGNYGTGWEDLTADIDRKGARADLWDYRNNETQHQHRLVRRKVLRTDYEKGKY